MNSNVKILRDDIRREANEFLVHYVLYDLGGRQM